jgi:hypothetical protein
MEGKEFIGDISAKDPEEFVCKFLAGIFTIVNNNQVDYKEKIRLLREIAFSICFEPKMNDFRKELQSNEQLRNITERIHDILVDEHIADSDKPTKILNFILEHGRSKFDLRKTNDIIISAKSQLSKAISIPHNEARKYELKKCLEFCKNYPIELESFRKTVEDCLIDANLKPLW